MSWGDRDPPALRRRGGRRLQDRATPPFARALASAMPPRIDESQVLRAMFTAHPDALLVIDGTGRIVLANAGAESLLGYEPQGLLGVDVEALVPEATRPRHASWRATYGLSARRRPMGFRIELEARRKDGSGVNVEVGLSPLSVQGADFVMASIRDIANYPRVKQALQQARYSDHLAQLGRLAVDAQQQRALIDHLPVIAASALHADAVSVLLLERYRLRFRVAACAGAVEGEPLGTLIPHRRDALCGFVLWAGVPVISANFDEEYRFGVPQAYRDAGMASALGVPLFDRGRAIGVLVARSREVERFGEAEAHLLESMANLLATSLQRAQTEEALGHAQRLESVGRLTGGIAHDFNNLLTVIQGNLQVLAELPSLAADAAARQLVAAATRASRRGAELTGKLLAYSRRQVLQPVPVDVPALLQSLSDMLHRTLDQRIRLQVRVQPHCPPVLADPIQLESSLLNVAINARDAMPDGGVLRFEAEPCAALPADLRPELGGPEDSGTGFVAISVTDSGRGMPEEVRERAFEPFFTTKAAGRGTGLGLSTAYGFVRQSRGAITIDTAPGAGTKVTLFIPCPPAGARAEEEAPEPVQALPPGLRVLLVEDDPEVRSVGQTLLGQLRCEVSACGTGEQALRQLESEGPFDLLLTDVVLGAGMRGTALARAAHLRWPELPVLLTSGFSPELLSAADGEPAPSELLRKPYGEAELARAIARALAPHPD